MKKLSFLFLFVFLFGINNAQTVSNSELLWQLKGLKNTGSVLYLAAHPDDENTRLISYLANERQVRTTYLSLTRGDGGQNLIGSEKGVLLGMIRTQELLAARRTDRATQFFSRAYDFGYSKSPEETFHFWNKDSVLADAVWVIRTFKPDVIICRFPTTGEGGHGHHTASAIIAEEAFTAAADPKRFPEQLKYTDVWQAKRLLWNTFNFGSRNTTSEDQLKIDVGGFNPLLGKYNGEIAAESRSMHKSQGFGSAKGRGSQLEYFKHIKGTEAKTDLFDGVALGWNRFSTTLKSAEELDTKIDQLIEDYHSHIPHEKFLQELLKLYNTFRELQSVEKENEELLMQLDLKLKALKRIILTSCGVWMDATADVATVSPGQELTIKYSLLSWRLNPVYVVKVSVAQKDTNVNFQLSGNELKTFSQTVQIPNNKDYSSPYWLKTLPEKGLFQVHDILKNTQAENAPALEATVRFKILSNEFSVKIPVRYKMVNPVKGEVYQPLQVLPKVAVNVPNANYLFTETTAKTIPVTLTSFTDSIAGKLMVNAPKGWAITIPDEKFSLKGKGAQTVIPVKIIPGKNVQDAVLQFAVQSGKENFNQSITRIEYDHIPNQVLVRPASAHLTFEPMVVPKIKVGYIPGAGDEVAELLEELGLNVTLLSDEDLKISVLKNYDAILTGIRAYNVNDKLQIHYNDLMDYVKQGGNLVVQYNTNSRVGPLQTKMGPYPFTISRKRVTDETAPITLLQPQHAAFNMPNKITNQDFDGWIQERGIYFASEIDGHYQKLIEANDPNEEPNAGSLIVGPYGQGNFVYTGLVFFRELPAGVPGAYKLLVNLLSLPKNK